MASTRTDSTPPTANPLQGVPSHVVDLLTRLHDESLRQENALTRDDFKKATMEEVMRDKFIALDRDKAEFVYQLCRATGAETIVEAGTSFGVSTIYLALAASANASRTGRRARVIATEYEPTKAARAREYWAECGRTVTDAIDLREGDLRETLKTDLENVDLLLLDIWTPVALPTLKIVEPKMRYGAVVITDNTIGAARGYKDMLEYLRNPESCYINMTLPFSKGLEMSVYLP
ncbi:hypothetical protein PV08_01673 [Exophiala spinifera]|uniref:O-methyltransferase n=1 Tax=Exophiala spinifera TaxID=91928 RepID=A0A0D2CC89_9EURO|nr:uncharacterized protein PV08_01673 [Exophiala spinifera]KIW21094.1 hypothetical protein PV08_01673 [Exophiala spinifera]